MAMTLFEGRTLPGVFSDIPSRNALHEKENQLQEARKRNGRMWIWLLLMVGLLLAAGLAIAYFYNVSQQVTRDAVETERQRAALDAQLGEYRNISNRRTEIAQAREALFNTIQEQRNPVWRERLWETATRTWRDNRRQETLALAPNDPTTQPPPAQWSARSWSSVYTQAGNTLGEERGALQAVNEAVEDHLRRLRLGGGGGTTTTCVNPNPALCPATTP